MKNEIVCGAFDEIETVFDHKFTCDMAICVCVCECEWVFY